MTGSDQFGPCSPFFIVSSIDRSLRHYVDALGFVCTVRGPDPQDVFFAIVNRGSAQIMLKAIDENTPAIPNHTRHEWARWDTFIYVSDPDALAAAASLPNPLLAGEQPGEQRGAVGRHASRQGKDDQAGCHAGQPLDAPREQDAAA